MTENQTNEMFRLMNNAIKKIDGLGTKVDGLETRFEEAELKNEKFRQETNQNFSDLKQELRFMNRKTEVLIDDLMQTKFRVKDVEKRVDDLEQRDAA